MPNIFEFIDLRNVAGRNANIGNFLSEFTPWSRSIFVIINANNFETKHRRPYVLIAKMCFSTVHFVLEFAASNF